MSTREGARSGRRRARLCLLAVAALALSVGLTGSASGERFQLGNLVLDVDGTFKPKRLPRDKFAPITLGGRADISTVDGSLPPPVVRARIDYDRNGLLTTRGLPVCNPRKLTSTTTPVALRACRKALVGQGYGSGFVAFPEQEPFAAGSRVLAFNGPRRRGNPTVIFHAHAHVPVPTTFVVVGTIKTLKKGAYKYRFEVSVPSIAGGYGTITHFNMKVRRFWRHKGKRRSYTSARCRNGRLGARGEGLWADGTTLSGAGFRLCKVLKVRKRK